MITTDNVGALKVLNAKQLASIDFDFKESFQIIINDETFIAEHVLRVLPKRRLVVTGRWNNHSVVAKFFFHKQSAKEHFQRETKGLALLTENKIPSPAVLYSGSLANSFIYVVLFEKLPSTSSLETIWQERKSDTFLPALKMTLTELATQHVLGIRQKDLHFKNFLLAKKTVYTLDAGEIEMHPTLLSKKMSLDCLALFLAQLGVGEEALQEKLFKHYAKLRGWLIKKKDLFFLFLKIKEYNHKRWQDYAKKIFRNSSAYGKYLRFNQVAMYNRAYVGEEFKQFLKNPDHIFAKSDVLFLKKGRSATVIYVELDGHPLVIKRYNFKNWYHHLRKLFLRTRARKCWRLAHKMQLLGISTAKPIAFVERRFLGLHGKSYFVSEFILGPHSGQYLGKIENETVLQSGINAITELLKNLAKLDISHGDLKMTNILINTEGKPTLIDLDGAIEHANLSSLRKAWGKELKRFLHNFTDQPHIFEKFKTLLIR